ncbi:MAG TPA: ABC transporter permease [Anaerolineaceae bacterium]|nr:ABC transporter permease [Anaerolineaceae bacterium]HPN52003.1 ABC transporter permease [Anaerolineaceae bacterium]
MERLWTIMKKEFEHIWRDPRTMALIILLPGLLLILLGYGISGDDTDIPLAVTDLSQTSQSNALINSFTANRDFKLVYMVQSEDEILSLMDQDLVKAGLYIPEDYGRKISTNQQAAIQLYVNGSAEPSIVQTTQLKLNTIAQMAAQNILVDKIKVSGAAAASNLNMPIESYTRLLYNPNGESQLYQIPGLIPIILQVQALLLTALAIVKEREQGTMEQLIVTPIKPWELMLGKILPYLLVSLFNTLILLVLGDVLFGVSVAGNFWELFGLSAVFIIGSLGMGVLISNLSESQMQAIYLTVFVVIIPGVILSGLMFSRDNMPWFSYWFSELMPVTHYLEITRGIMLKGVSAKFLWPSIWPLLILSVLYFVASVFAFRKRI